MTKWLFLSKNAKDPVINLFAAGCRQPVINTEVFKYTPGPYPIVLRGIMKHKVIKQCWSDNRTFYYVDTGYFGNEKTITNPRGWKLYHRIVKNNLQHGEIIARPDDRWNKLGKTIAPWKKHGRKILVAKPDIKPCVFYGIDLEQWVSNTVETIKQYTDRPVVVRERAPKREDRITTDTLESALMDDVFALVTYNSIAATESVLLGIPAFTLAAANAASPVCSNDLSKIDNPYYPDDQKKHAWACHLSYGQFHLSELRDGSAHAKLEQWYG